MRLATRSFRLIGLVIVVAGLLLLIGHAGRVAAQGGGVTATAVPVIQPAVFAGDVRRLPPEVPYVKWDREIHPEPSLFKLAIEPADGGPLEPNLPAGPAVAMPSPVQNFAGLSRTDLCGAPPAQCGAGTPPDTNGDVGLNHYIQTVNTAVGIFNKSGTLLASFTFNQLWSGAGTGTPCDNANQGDPVTLYDPMADRWLITDFAFNGGGATAPFYECIAVSRTSDPVAGGWFLYALRTDNASHPWLNDYPKFGVWPDGIYMAANGFTSTFAGVEAFALNRYDLESGLPLRAFVAYIATTLDPMSMLPSNVRGNAPSAMPPAGTPNYFVSESNVAFAFEVRKFQVSADWTSATFSGATNVSQTSYTVPSGSIITQPNTTLTLDSLGDRLMQKLQYRKVGAAESLWVAHTFRSAAGPTGSQWAQLDVTGGVVATTPVQQQKYDPADNVNRWMSSIGADNAGNVALGYSASSVTISPSIRYAGRLAGDALNLLPQTEVVLQAGVGVQNGNCGGAPCHRWGDYSDMGIDPADDCTFWYTTEYYSTPASSTVGWATRIGSFRFSPAQCVASPVATTNHSTDFDGGVGSDWSSATERLGSEAASPNAFDYLMTWDSTNLYAGIKGLSNTVPYTFVLVIDTDPANRTTGNTGSAAAVGCASGFNSAGKGDFALVRRSADIGATTSALRASGGAWIAWSPGSTTDARDWGGNMAEFQVKWSDVGLASPAGTAGLYLFVCQDSTLLSAWPPENAQSGTPILNVETTVTANGPGQTPRTYSPHAGQETKSFANGVGLVSFLNGYVSLANVTGLSASCSFTAIVDGNLTSAPAANLAHRTYTLTPGAGCAGLSADLTLKYEDGAAADNATSEIAGLVESNLTLRKNVSGIWTDQGGTVNTAANTVQKTGVNSFSTWSFGTGLPTAVTVRHVTASAESSSGPALAAGALLCSALLALAVWRRRAAR